MGKPPCLHDPLSRLLARFVVGSLKYRREDPISLREALRSGARRCCRQPPIRRSGHDAGRLAQAVLAVAARREVAWTSLGRSLSARAR
jgi:hypothetical protein